MKKENGLKNKTYLKRLFHDHEIRIKKYIKLELGNYTTKEDLKNELANYPTKQDLKNELAQYATKHDLNILEHNLRNELTNYATKQDLDDMEMHLLEVLDHIVKNLEDLRTEVGALSLGYQRFETKFENHETRICTLEDKIS